jgi:hypothetical protein
MMVNNNYKVYGYCMRGKKKGGGGGDLLSAGEVISGIFM